MDEKPEYLIWKDEHGASHRQLIAKPLRKPREVKVKTPCPVCGGKGQLSPYAVDMLQRDMTRITELLKLEGNLSRGELQRRLSLNGSRVAMVVRILERDELVYTYFIPTGGRPRSMVALKN